MGFWIARFRLLDYVGKEEEMENSPNPFAFVVLTHLKGLETRKNPESRYAWKIRIVKGLYERGWDKKDIRQLFRFIDWIMSLQEELEDSFWGEVQNLEEEKKMPYMISGERIARKQELLKGIELGLKLKFGIAGINHLPEISKISDIEILRSVLTGIETATTFDELRRIYSANLEEKNN